MSERFYTCFDIVVASEGKFVDHVADKGGRTNYGVTQKTLDAYNYDKHQPSYDVKGMSLDTVKDIYHQYWVGAKCDSLEPQLDLLAFDCAINSGAGKAIKLLQQVVGVNDDGAFGSQTSKALCDRVALVGVKQVCLEYLNVRKAYYRRIVDRDPTQAVFLKGWYNRITKLEGLVDV